MLGTSHSIIVCHITMLGTSHSITVCHITMLGTSHAGPLTRSVKDAAIYLDVTSGPDSRDIYSLPPYTGSFSSELHLPLPKLRIAFCAKLGGVERLERSVERVFETVYDRLRALGHTVERISNEEVAS